MVLPDHIRRPAPLFACHQRGTTVLMLAYRHTPETDNLRLCGCDAQFFLEISLPMRKPLDQQQ